jgi:hypothetical protein
MMEEESERVREENIQVFNIENILVYTHGKKTRMGSQPTSSSLQWWLSVTMVAFNIPSNLSPICSSTLARRPLKTLAKMSEMKHRMKSNGVKEC